MYLSGNQTTMQGTWLAQESADDRCGSGRVRRLINERSRPPAGGGVHRVRVRRCTETAESVTGRIVLFKARGRCPDDRAQDRSPGRGLSAPDHGARPGPATAGPATAAPDGGARPGATAGPATAAPDGGARPGPATAAATAAPDGGARPGATAGPATAGSADRHPHPLAPPATGLPHTWMRY